MKSTEAVIIRHRWGGLLAPKHGGFELVYGWQKGGRWTRDNAEKLMPMLPALAVQTAFMSIEPAPACGCCGEWRVDQISIETDAAGERALRCDKHVGRLPCCIEGCGKTFKMEAADSYATVTMCGRHWRLAPLYMRQAVARVRRVAKRVGWTDAICARHSRLWWRCKRAIEQRGDVGGEGHIDIDEIERMFG